MALLKIETKETYRVIFTPEEKEILSQGKQILEKLRKDLEAAKLTRTEEYVDLDNAVLYLMIALDTLGVSD